MCEVVLISPLSLHHAIIIAFVEYASGVPVTVGDIQMLVMSVNVIGLDFSLSLQFENVNFFLRSKSLRSRENAVA